MLPPDRPPDRVFFTPWEPRVIDTGEVTITVPVGGSLLTGFEYETRRERRETVRWGRYRCEVWVIHEVRRPIYSVGPDGEMTVTMDYRPRQEVGRREWVWE